jgi:hypothetical protein
MDGVFDGRVFKGGLEVDDNAQWLSNCFHAERQLLHTMAGALPRVADMRVKIILGTHLWEVARTLRDFSARLAELREHSDYPARPGAGYEEILARLDEAPTPWHQLAGIYAVLSPALIDTYDAYLSACDPLLDEPTVRVLTKAQRRHLEFQRDRDLILGHVHSRTSLQDDMAEWTGHLEDELSDLGSICEVPLRRRQTRLWSAGPPLERFARPAEFTYGPDHGIDRRAIYGSVAEFYFPLDQNFLRHFLHHMVDAEIVAAEIMALNIFENPEMPLAFHVDMARQVWDEVRHARVQWEFLSTMGVMLGSYPVFHGFDLLLSRRGLLERLILFNRLGEAGAAQRHRRRNRLLRENGLQNLAILFDYLHADEIPHVANGERWGKYLFNGSVDAFAAYCRRVQAEFQAEFALEYAS